MKQIVTDKMIEDIINSTPKKEIPIEGKVQMTKNNLKQKGYRVEEKTALEDVYDYIAYIHESENCNQKMEKLEEMLNEAIEEIQQEPVIDDDLIEWLKFIACDNHYFSHTTKLSNKYFHELAEKLLKQLGVK